MHAKLDLRSIQADGLLLPALLETYAQAAEVCLAGEHASPIVLSVHDLDLNAPERAFEIRWGSIGQLQKNSYASVIDAVEAGAYAVALSVVRETHGMVAFSRADDKSGADFYARTPGNHDDDLEDVIRIEVSGSKTDRTGEINHRMREKVTQLFAGDSNLPGLACVVGFKLKLVKIKAVP